MSKTKCKRASGLAEREYESGVSQKRHLGKSRDERSDWLIRPANRELKFQLLSGKSAFLKVVLIVVPFKSLIFYVGHFAS